MTLPVGASSLPPSLALIAAGIRWPTDGITNAQIALLADVVEDWDEVLALARRHRVEALLDHGLRTAGIRPAPEPARLLSQRAGQSAFAELLYVNETIRLSAAFKEAGVSSMVVKGAATAILCYGRLGLRSNRDIDLLVRPRDIAAALILLEGRGYVIDPGARPREPKWIGRHKDVSLVHERSGMTVELHWRLFDNRRLFPRPWGIPSRTLPLGDGTIDTLAAELTFPYMCLHGAHHAWSRLKWLAEIDALLAEAGIEGADQLYLTAVRHQAGPAAAQAMGLCARLFGRPLPPSAEKAIRENRRLRWLIEIAFRAATRGGSAEMESLPMGSTLKNLSHYLLAGGFRYWVEELTYDLADTSASRSTDSLPAFGIVGRVFEWSGKAFGSLSITHRNKNR